MDYFEKLAKKRTSRKSLFYTVLGVASALILGFILLSLDNFYIWLGLNASGEQAEYSAQFYRNRGFFTFAIAGFILTAIGMALTYWGRIQTREQIEKSQEQIEKTQVQIELNRKANESERYENATRMLGDSLLAVRVAGCHALGNLGSSDVVDNQEMAARCLILLTAYINNPYLNESEKQQMGARSDSRFTQLEILFSHEKKLRIDIQVAADGISSIYQNLDDTYDEWEEPHELQRIKLNLPPYFWKNITKNKITFPLSILTEANLHSASLIEADLSDSTLIGADLSFSNLARADCSQTTFAHANLAGSTLSGAILEDAVITKANLTNCDLRSVQGLTKEQIISATWGHDILYGRDGEKLSPVLPINISLDEDIKKWLKNPPNPIQEN